MQVRTPRITFLAAGVPALLGRADHDERIHFLHRQRQQRAFITDRQVRFMSQQACTQVSSIYRDTVDCTVVVFDVRMYLVCLYGAPAAGSVRGGSDARAARGACRRARGVRRPSRVEELSAPSVIDGGHVGSLIDGAGRRRWRSFARQEARWAAFYCNRAVSAAAVEGAGLRCVTSWLVCAAGSCRCLEHGGSATRGAGVGRSVVRCL